jgi:hypothetical protein
VNWTAPVSLGLPQNCRIELIVSDGPRIAANTVVVRVHNSAIEVGDLALLFLTEFADNSIPAATTVRNFSDSCPGKASERDDVADVRKEYRINSYTYGTQTVTVRFGGTCNSKSADACVRTPVEWKSTFKPGTPDEKQVNPKGTSFISGIYRESRWWLCDSTLDDPASLGLWPMR